MTKYIKDVKDNTSRGVLQDIWKKLKQLEFSIGNGNGGGNTPNLQQVTDEGNTTNQDIEIVKLNASKKISVRTAGMQEREAGMISNIGFFLRNMLGTTILNIGNNTADRTLSLPDEDGILATQQYVQANGGPIKGFFKASQAGTSNPSIITMKTNLPAGTVSLVRDGIGSYYLSIPSGWGISTNTTKFMITIAEFSVATSRMDVATYGDGMGGLVVYFFVKNRATNNPIDLNGEFKFSIDKF